MIDVKNNIRKEHQSSQISHLMYKTSAFIITISTELINWMKLKIINYIHRGIRKLKYQGNCCSKLGDRQLSTGCHRLLCMNLSNRNLHLEWHILNYNWWISIDLLWMILRVKISGVSIWKKLSHFPRCYCWELHGVSLWVLGKHTVSD